MLQKAVGCTTTMPISGRQGSADIGLPVQPAVMPTVAPVVPATVAPIVPTAIAPATVAPAAVAPTAVAPPGKLGLGVDRDERHAVPGVLLHGVGNRQAYRLQALGDFARLLGIGTVVLREAGRGIGRRQAHGKTESARRQQGSQRANGTTILGHVISLSLESTLPRLAIRRQMKRPGQFGSMPARPPPCSRSESIHTR